MDSKVIVRFCLLFLLITSCGILSKKETLTSLEMSDPKVTSVSSISMHDLKKVVVYKTKKDYVLKVPILMSELKETIIAYPAPTDLSNSLNGQNAIKLENGYLLDLIGISKNSVFTDYNIESYKNSVLPSLQMLSEKIIDFNPFTEMYYCDFNQSESSLNTLIRNHHLADSCMRVK